MAGPVDALETHCDNFICLLYTSFVAKIALQIGLRIGGELQALLPQFVGQLGQEEDVYKRQE